MKRIALLGILALILCAGVAVADTHTLSVGSSFSLIHSADGSLVGGGSISPSSLDGNNLPYLYCVDFGRTIYAPGEYNATAVTNNGTIFGSGVANAANVAFLLQEYADDQTVNSAALQAAIWHVIFGFSISETDNLPDMVTEYKKYVTDVGRGDVSLFSWISPQRIGSTIQYQGQVTRVPEPSLVLLLGIGLGAVTLLARRYKA